MKKWKLHELVPPGVDGEKHADRLYTGLLLSTILSCMGFAFSIGLHWKQVQDYVPSADGTYVLFEHDFLGTLLFPLVGVSIYFGFVYVAIAAIILAISYYRGFSQESQALYLMRRLPDRWELARRCLALPLMTIGICALAILVLTLIFFGIYWAITPEGLKDFGQLKTAISYFYLLFVPATFVYGLV
jgi:hypothetical protein